MTLNNFDEFIDKTDYLQTRLLQVNSCGSERVVKYDYTILRSNGRRDFHFLYLQNGWLDIEVGTAKARLSRGQCAVFLPNVRQMYSFTAAGDPSRSICILPDRLRPRPCSTCARRRT